MPSLRAAALTDIGRVRRENEDRLLCDEKALLFGVADGVGGLPGGAEAAQLAIEGVHGSLLALSAGREPDLVGIVQHTNHTVATLGQQISPNMGIGTTLTIGCVLGSLLKIAHVGEDSGDTGAIYAYGVQNFTPNTMNSSVDQVTIDDVRADPSMLDSPPRGVHMDFGGCGFTFSNIQVTNVQGDQYHGPSAVECNEFANDSWRDGFDTSKMRYDQIGLTAQFPYPVGQ